MIWINITPSGLCNIIPPPSVDTLEMRFSIVPYMIDWYDVCVLVGYTIADSAACRSITGAYVDHLAFPPVGMCSNPLASSRAFCELQSDLHLFVFHNHLAYVISNMVCRLVPRLLLSNDEVHPCMLRSMQECLCLLNGSLVLQYSPDRGLKRHFQQTSLVVVVRGLNCCDQTSF
ncbi:hypothetical protein Tco_0890691 [Tanacetum coccineum]|uniref:Uncharacterized protein n=1 Tax=Tanacetum coccineum TaxID=301880 RepID=A0ABQ5C6R1_9ASTR